MAVNAKRSVYLPHAQGDELDAEAARTERSASWLIQFALKVARPQIKALPTVHATHDAPANATGCDNPGIVPPTP